MNKKIFDYSIDTDEETLQQFRDCYSKDFVVSAALMPDAHKGYVAPIGAVLKTKDYIVPAWVGYDIGCGMTAIKIKGKKYLKLIENKKNEIFEEVKKNIPMGLGEINKPERITKKGKEKYEELVNDFQKGPYNKQVLNFLKSGKAERYIGSLGNGNHFISLNKDDSGNIWIIVHSGSRGVGHWVAKMYMKKSAGKRKKFEETYPLKVDSEIGKEYLNLLDFGLKFALLNRMEMVRKTISSIEKILDKKLKWTLWANKNHNHPIKEGDFWVHRKGATPAKKGERGIIPANMKEGSFLVKGKGNEKFLKSSSHGAGRKLSRKEAKEKISVEELKKEMEGIVADIDSSVVDESPRAYKNIYDVLNAQKESVKIIKHLTPIINWQE